MHERRPRSTNVLTVLLSMTVALACEDVRESNITHEPQVLTGQRPGLVEVAPGTMQSPVRLTLNHKGNLYVSDFQSQSVLTLEPDGGSLFATGAFMVPGKPLGVAWAKGNRLLVGNSSTKTVDVYRTSSGRWLFALGGIGAIGDPSDIAVDFDRDLAFVADGDAKAIKVFDLRDGAPLSTISGPGPGSLSLQNPTGIAVDPGLGEVLVTDYGDPSLSDSPPAIKIYTYDGDHVRTLSGKSGMIGQKFSRPQGLAIDGYGRIVMVDAVAGQVLVLDRETGSVLETLGSFGTGPGELWLPLDVVVDESGNVFVTNNRSQRVEVFSLGGQAP